MTKLRSKTSTTPALAASSKSKASTSSAGAVLSSSSRSSYSTSPSSSALLPKLQRLPSHNAQIAGLYDLEHKIGEGHFAVVKLARHVFTGEKVAAKVIDKTRLDPISTVHMIQEVRCMKLVQHPNIVRLYEVIDTQTKLFLILELGDCDMYEWVMKRGYDKAGCKEADAQLYFSQIIKAINYCHKLHVVHRDLKPENVVFFEKLGMVKLTDFGFSNLFTPGQQLQTSCGSLAYSAPEILLGDAYDAPAVDVWSLGVILYMLVCGRLPFQESNDSETLTRILDCKFSFPEHVSVDCRKLISAMLVRDPAKRATLAAICQNKWVCAGDRGHAEALPLIVKEHLPICDHATIIEQMVAGQIGTEEEILGAIERNEYNHLTATYFLLAERVLYHYRQEQANRLMQAAAREFVSVDENSSGDNPQSLGHFGSERASSSSSARSRSRSNSWRGPAPRRAYSILKEESEEELFSYLRSSSRQSSRFYNAPPVAKSRAETNASSRASFILAMSRANSNDSFAPVGSSAILEDEVESEEMDEGVVKGAVGSSVLEEEEEEEERRRRRGERRMGGECGSGGTGGGDVSSTSTSDFEQQQKQVASTSGGGSGATASPFELPPPSATSTPLFLQRLLAPIHENNRDQSPDSSSNIVGVEQQRLKHKISAHSTSTLDQSDEESSPSGSGSVGGGGGGASFYLPRQATPRQRTTSASGGRSSLHRQQQLPPLPNSPEQQHHHSVGKLRNGSGGGSIGRNSFSTSSFSGGGNNANNNNRLSLAFASNTASSASARPLRNAASLEVFPTQIPVFPPQNGAFFRVNGGGSLANSRCGQPATSPSTPNPANGPQHFYSLAYPPLWGAPASLERHANFMNLNTLASSSNLLKQQRKSSTVTVGSSLSRRNSSPSVSMLRASSLHSSRDRISPQAIQELLELSRLSSRMRRTASPDGGASSSHLSSRSASPSCISSGRVSPSVSSSPGGIMMRMLKGNTGSGGASGSLLSSTGGGMRKLSSSPHLLGICEETEECDLHESSNSAQVASGDDLLDSCGGRFTMGCNNSSGRRSANDVITSTETFAKGAKKCSCSSSSPSSSSSTVFAGGSTSSSQLITRSARSASMGLTSMGRLSLGNLGCGGTAGGGVSSKKKILSATRSINNNKNNTMTNNNS